MKGQLSIGLMQLKIYDLLKESGECDTYAIHSVCEAIEELKTCLDAYVPLVYDRFTHESNKDNVSRLRDDIRCIGETLNDYGGMKLMLACCYLVSYTNDKAYDCYLNSLWNGIGGWSA